MPKPKPIENAQLRNKNTVSELHESNDKIAKSRVINLDRIGQIKQVKKWLEKVQKS